MDTLSPDTSSVEDLPTVEYLVTYVNEVELVKTFSVAARRAGWTEATLSAVIKEAMADGGYYVRTRLARYCRVSYIY